MSLGEAVPSGTGTPAVFALSSLLSPAVSRFAVGQGAKDRVEPRSARLYAGRLRVKVLLAKGSAPPRRFALLLDPLADQQGPLLRVHAVKLFLL